jgi:plastocyanin
VGLRRRYLPWLACAAMAATAVPALAWGQGDPPVSASIVVTDTGFRDAASDDSTVEIPAGGTVGFSYPEGSSRHNIIFLTLQPTSCKQTAGENWGAVPPLPWYLQGPGWAGTCTFAQPGTYEFRSGMSYAMRGSVVVGATPTPTPTPTATATATPMPARIEAKDSATRNWFQDASSASDTDSSVIVKVGERVTFAFPAGASSHNVTFPNAPKPALCPQTKAANAVPFLDADDAPPMPGFAQPVGWEGNCTFDAPGTYTFVCGTHPEMTGTVVVQNAGEPTPTPTPTATPTATATPTPTPTATPVTRPGIVAHDAGSNWFQDAASSDPADNTVTVDLGATVDFSYPAGSSAHNVEFATNPTSCTQKTGVVITAAPPLPSFAQPAPWTGECTFSTPGVYTFVCSAHRSEMTGSVVVKTQNGGEPTPTPTATPTATATPEPPRDLTPAKTPKIWAAIDKPTTKAMTVSSLLKGKLKITSRCTSAGSGMLTLTVSTAVANRIGLNGTKIGSADATCDGHGRFTVKLKPTAAAKKALDDYPGSVKVTAKLELAGPIGQTSATRTINLKGKGRA